MNVERLMKKYQFISPIDDEEYINKINDILKCDSRERILQEYVIQPLIESILKNYDVVPVDTKVNGKIHNYELYCGKYGYYKEGKLVITTETPDLCIAKNWLWANEQKSKSDYCATVEIKSVFSKPEFLISPGYDEKGNLVSQNALEELCSFINGKMLSVLKNQNAYDYQADRKYPKTLKKQIGIHLRGIDKVIVTDGIRWIFFYKENGKCYSLPPIDLGKRICKKSRTKYRHNKIDWCIDETVIKGKTLKSLRNYNLLTKVIEQFCISPACQMEDIRKMIPHQN